VTKRRGELDQAFGGGAGLAPGNAFQIAPAQQQKDKHRHRIKIHAMVDVIEQRPQAGKKRGENANCHRRIHAHPPRFQVAPGGAIKRHGRIHHHRQGEDKTGPVQ
jgi:hypothetical protein